MGSNIQPRFTHRDAMTSDVRYVEWISDLKRRFVSAQGRAAVRVNSEMLGFYWSLGRDMYNMNISERWGEGVVSQLALDLRNSFPNEKGFSDTNIKYIRRWYLFYNQPSVIGQQPADQLEKEIGQQPADQIAMPEKFAMVPWYHHVEIFTKSKSVEEALFYIDKTIEGNWSRSILEDNIASKLYERQGAALTNFGDRLPQSQGQLAQEILKDPYCFGFLSMKKGYDERELEDALINNITRFLLELGKGFAFVGRQMELRMPNGTSFFPDLIFYHIPLKSYVVIDLKAVDFEPEFAGKINFYVSAVDELMKGEGDNPTIGLIICKSSDKTVVEWSFRGVDRPLGVATYQLQEVVDRTVTEIEQKVKAANKEDNA